MTNSEAPFFAVSTKKFVVLAICTLGFYAYYWFYKSWRRVKEREQASFSAAFRTSLGWFFSYPLFRRIKDYPSPSAVNKGFPAAWLSALGIGFNFFTLFTVASDYIDDLNILHVLSLLEILVLIPVVRMVAKINAEAAPESDPNAGFSAINWLTIAAGTGLIAYLIYSTVKM